MHILFAASEMAPFVKTGGLGDVIGALPIELRREGVDVSVILPLYEAVAAGWRSQMTLMAELTVKVGWRKQYCGIRLLRLESGVSVYFVDNEYYFKRSQIYGHFDDGERFLFFCSSVLAAIPHIGPVDILHCHDWQTGAVSLLLDEKYRSLQAYSSIRTVFTIHNLRFQGWFSKNILPELMGMNIYRAVHEDLEYHDSVNFLKTALYHSNAITTVSPTYSREICTSEYGEGLEGVFHKLESKLIGILNGLDIERYNPQTDASIIPYQSYEGKADNKTAFQREFVMQEDNNAMMVGMVGRLDRQKGFDLVQRVIDDMLRLPIQFVCIGTGDGEIEAFLRQVERRYPERARCFIEFDAEIAQKIYASSDVFLMPSQFEPCGLSQMIAMRYGTIPLVRETGGLKDTVEPYNAYTNQGTGFSFTHYNAHDMLHVLEWAYKIYAEQPKKWKEIAERAMQVDFSWKQSVKQYITLYKSIL